jgi:hypothetical protein
MLSLRKLGTAAALCFGIGLFLLPSASNAGVMSVAEKASVSLPSVTDKVHWRTYRHHHYRRWGYYPRYRHWGYYPRWRHVRYGYYPRWRYYGYYPRWRPAYYGYYPRWRYYGYYPRWRPAYYGYYPRWRYWGYYPRWRYAYYPRYYGTAWGYNPVGAGLGAGLGLAAGIATAPLWGTSLALGGLASPWWW